MTAPAPYEPARTARTARALGLAAAVTEGVLPGPRDPLEAARLALARALQRGTPPLDEVRFTAGCPGCGQGCEWRETRVETRLRIEVGCGCERRPEDARQAGPAPASVPEQPVPPVVGARPVVRPGRGA